MFDSIWLEYVCVCYLDMKSEFCCLPARVAGVAIKLLSFILSIYLTNEAIEAIVGLLLCGLLFEATVELRRSGLSLKSNGRLKWAHLLPVVC